MIVFYVYLRAVSFDETVKEGTQINVLTALSIKKVRVSHISLGNKFQLLMITKTRYF